MNLPELEKAFEKNFAQRGELGASVSVWRHGEEVVSLAHGWCEREREREWTAETLVPFYSTTKGLAAATLLMLLEERGMTPDDEVGDVWPRFPVEGATFAQLMSHRLGLAALDEKVSVWDHDEVIGAVERQSPNWPLGSGHGYHPRVLGFIQDEIVRRLAGKTLGALWWEKIAEPLGLEVWMGLPESEIHRVASLYPGKQDKSDLESGFYRDLHTPGSLVKRAFFSLRGMHSVREMNDVRAWRAGFPAMGGIGTAKGVAKFYQAACGAIPFFSPKLREWMGTVRSSGEDKVLKTKTAFTCGFQCDPVDGFGRKDRHHYGLSRRAFGHPGAGGSHAFGDPESGISFTYVMNQMELSPLPGEKCLDMVKAIYVM
ncbi:MAG: beta-lactamase family protein [Verrucomicrobiae bacterium]|nr:beta-lactamase family protein [Verrucomicrobiae bacterium]NNJ44097.1 beta-lactamase family protein [Akkermansiaceae bacterium]